MQGSISWIVLSDASLRKEHSAVGDIFKKLWETRILFSRPSHSIMIILLNIQANHQGAKPFQMVKSWLFHHLGSRRLDPGLPVDAPGREKR